MNRKNLSIGLCLLLAGLLAMGCSQAVVKPEPQKNAVQVAKAEVTDSHGNKIIDQLTPKEKYRLRIELVNLGQRAIPAGKIKISSTQPEVRIEQGNANFKSLAPQERAAADSPIIFSVSKNFALANVVLRGLVGADNVGSFKPTGVVVPQSVQDSVEVVDYIVDDTVGGNGDGRINPGEQVKVRLRLKNIGSHPINPSQAVVTALQPGVTMLEPLISFPAMPQKGDTALSFDDFTMAVAPNFPEPVITVQVSAIIGANYKAYASAPVFNGMSICIDDFTIVRETRSCDGKTITPDLLKIRLAICNQYGYSIQNVIARVAADKIWLCGEANVRTIVDNVYYNDKVYFGGNIDANNCAHPTSSCEYQDKGQKVVSATKEELVYIIDLNGLKANEKYCFNFYVELFKNADVEKCAPAGNHPLTRLLCYSYEIPPLLNCIPTP